MRFLLCFAAVAVFAQEPVDLILHHGKVFTADANLSIAEAVAIRGDKIVAVGSSADLLKRYKATRTIDLGGKLLQPGFDDVHIHMRGDPSYFVDLAEVKSIQEIRTKVAAKAKTLPKGAWITGYGWSEDQVEEKRKPNRKDLDQAAPANPVALTRAGGHSSVGNSMALKIAGVDKSTADPERGVIEHDDQGEPTGVIRERNDLFTRHVPKEKLADLTPSLTAKLKALFAKGITSIIEANTSIEGYAEWQKIYAAHAAELPRAALQIGWPGVEALQKFGKKTGDGDEHLRVGAIKLFIDGGFTGPAAYTIEPYKNQGEYRGKLTRTPEEFYSIFKDAHRLGWQLGLHTIGDGAIKLAADTLARVIDENPRADHRHYLNHFSMTPPEETYQKMASHGIWIAQQPNFTYTLEGRYRDNLDDRRLQINNPVATPMKHGIFVALSSDILPIGPLVGLYGAATRKGMSGTVYGIEEAIPMSKAIAGYTRNGAYFTREEKIKGTIEAGKLADMIVMSQDLLTVDPTKIMDTQVELTILGGRVVYSRK
jgi:predicted amidohydrolase YtcJ